MLKMLDFIEMRRCFGCSRTGKYFCDECAVGLIPRSVQFQKDFKLSVVANQNPALMRAISAWKDNHLKQLTKVFAELFAMNISKLDPTKTYQLVTTPIRKAADKSRGFKPMVDLANELCKVNSNLSFSAATLGFRRSIRDQRTLDIDSRKSNLNNAFICNEKPLHSIILLDDVVTSGATLFEMRRTILRMNLPVQAMTITSSHNIFRLNHHKEFS